MSDLLIEKAGNFLGLQMVAGGTLPSGFQHQVHKELTYTHIEYLFGKAAWDPVTGQRRTISTSRRGLFSYDNEGRLLCARGFLPLIQRLATEHGLSVVFVDKNKARTLPRPRCYEEHWERVFSRIEFRPRQEECLFRIATHEMGVIEAPPAFGKSFLIKALGLLYPRAKIDVVTTRLDVLKNLHREISDVIPNVGIVNGSKKDWARITCISAASLHHADGTADFLLADEGHELVTDRYTKNLVKYQYARRFTFTATPKCRTDGTNIRLTAMFGNTIFHMPYEEAENLGVVVPVVVNWYDVVGPDPAASAFSGVDRKRRFVWCNDHRNQIIAKSVRDFDGAQVLILVEKVEHALHLRKLLPEFTLVYSEGAVDRRRRESLIHNGWLQPDDPIMTTALREDYRRAFRDRRLMRVIATDVWSTGVDFPGLEVIARAEGLDSERVDYQGPGRVFRLSPETGKTVGYVIDYIDQANAIFRNKATNRRRRYANFGWTQVLPDRSLWEPRRERSLSGN